MAVDVVDITLSFFHLIGAFIWIGTIFYIGIIFTPVMNKLEPPLRGTVMKNLVPRQSNVLTIALILTGVTGMVRSVLLVPNFSLYTTSAWGWGILGGTIASILMAVIGFFVIIPAGKKMLSITAAEPPPEIAKLQKRIETGSIINFVLAFIVIFGMAIAG